MAEEASPQRPDPGRLFHQRRRENGGGRPYRGSHCQLTGHHDLPAADCGQGHRGLPGQHHPFSAHRQEIALQKRQGQDLSSGQPSGPARRLK